MLLVTELRPISNVFSKAPKRLKSAQSKKSAQNPCTHCPITHTHNNWVSQIVFGVYTDFPRSSRLPYYIATMMVAYYLI